MGSQKIFDDMFDYKGEKKKPSRPEFWRGYGGSFLVSAVEEILATDERCNLATAIRRAIRIHQILKDCNEVHGISDRALQARYQQADDFWADALETLKRNGIMSWSFTRLTT
jgi:hypothetical protein